MRQEPVRNDFRAYRQVHYATFSVVHDILVHPVLQWIACFVIIFLCCIGVPIVIYWVLGILGRL